MKSVLSHPAPMRLPLLGKMLQLMFACNIFSSNGVSSIRFSIMLLFYCQNLFIFRW